MTAAPSAPGQHEDRHTWSHDAEEGHVGRGEGKRHRGGTFQAHWTTKIKSLALRSLAYVAPELYGRGGQRVQIRYMPHDGRSIEVYDGERNLCTAYPTGRLTAAQADAFREHARAEAERLGRERRRASRRPAAPSRR